MSAEPASRYLVGSIPWYSVLMVLGTALAIWLAAREEKRVNLPKDTILDLALWLIPCGIIGARLYYVAFSWEEFRDAPVSVLYVWQGGIAIFGAILAGLLTLLLFCRHRRLPPLLLCDVIVPGLALAQAIGRWGNYFNMEAYGPEVTNPALCFFPLAVLIPSGSGSTWHLATFFYESLCDFLIFVFLLAARRRLFRRQGDVFFFYLFLYSAARLVIEDLRMDSLYSSSVRVSQLLSVLLCLAILTKYVLQSRERKTGMTRCGRFLGCLSLLYGIPILLYTFHAAPFEAFTMKQRLCFLAGFSLLSVLSLFLTYGPSRLSEVCYADNPK